MRSRDRKQIIREMGRDALLDSFRRMLLVRHFEQCGEAAYQRGKVGGFYHSYIGQEAIQTGFVAAAGQDHWYTTTYRCHALALLLGATPRELMAELYGKASGNVKGRGGSMHFFTDRLLGGLAIVGGHVPLATGAGFTIKYLEQKGVVSFCFLGDGSVAQGAVHESLNLASLWNLPCIYVVENNRWGMGTSVTRALSVTIEKFAKGYGMRSYQLDGMDFFDCYAGCKEALHEVLASSRPVLIEAMTQRFRGHSISDPGHYRSKEELQRIIASDPILSLKETLIEEGIVNEEQCAALDREQREVALEAMRFAEESPWPDPMTLEEGVLAP